MHDTVRTIPPENPGLWEYRQTQASPPYYAASVLFGIGNLVKHVTLLTLRHDPKENSAFSDQVVSLRALKIDTIVTRSCGQPLRASRIMDEDVQAGRVARKIALALSGLSASDGDGNLSVLTYIQNGAKHWKWQAR